NGRAAAGLCLSLPCQDRNQVQIKVDVHPAGRGGGMEDAILASLERVALDRHRSETENWTLSAMVNSRNESKVDLMERHGYQPVRWFPVLERELTGSLPDAPEPDGIAIRIMIPE